MRISVEIDGNQHILDVNSDKPLNMILEDIVPSFPVHSSCLGASCGNCIIFLNGAITLSCLVPAFKLVNNDAITTFEGYKKKRQYHDIEEAYKQTGRQPCRQCYAAKTMIIETLVSRMEAQNSSKNLQSPLAHTRHDTIYVQNSLIAREISISSCQCIDIPEIEAIIRAAYINRSKRSVRYSPIT